MSESGSHNIPVIEVHDFHLETFPFWEHYLGKTHKLHYYFPLRRFMRKPNGSMGGVFQSVITRDKMHRLSELTDTMHGPFAIFNSVPLSTDKDWAAFDTLTEKIAPAFPGAIMAFHGKHPMVLQRAEIQKIISRFRFFRPIFLHPFLSNLESNPPLTVCLPLLPRQTRSLPPPPSKRDPLRIGVIGIIWGNCRNYDMLLETAAASASAQIPVEYYIIGGIPARPDGNRAYREIRSKAQYKGVLHLLHFYLNLPSDRFHTVVSSLHFIAPLTFMPLYETIILSGSVPLALSLGIPLLLKKSFAKNYKLTGQLTYTNHLQETLPFLARLTPVSYWERVDSVYKNYETHHKGNIDSFRKLPCGLGGMHNVTPMSMKH